MGDKKSIAELLKSMDDAQREVLRSIEPAVSDAKKFIEELLKGSNEGATEFFEGLFRYLFCERNSFTFSDRIMTNRFLEVFEDAYYASDAKGKETIRYIILNSDYCKAYFGDNLLDFVEDHLPSK